MRWLSITACTALCCAMLALNASAGPMTLAEKARIFQHDMAARFLLDGQALCKLSPRRTPSDPVSYKMPDNAYMTGLYLGAISMKYAVTQDAADREAARRSLEALHLLCNVSGKKGLLARAAWPVDRPLQDDGQWRTSPDGKYKWRGDVSTDQMDGVVFGLSLAYDLMADETGKALIAQDVAALADHVLENDLRIVDIDGNETTWGRYYPAYARLIEPMNALLLLQLLKVAHHVTGEARFGEAYRKWAVEKEYAQVALRARRSRDPNVRGGVNHSDDVLLFLGYEPLLRLEQDPAIRGPIVASFKRAYEGTEKYPGMEPEGNPLYAFLAAKYLDDTDMIGAATDTLRWFPFRIKWEREVIAQYERELGFVDEPAPASPEPADRAPLPVDRRAKTWSAWVQDPYNDPLRAGAHDPVEYNGHDYLLGYWLGRYYGFIPAEW